MQVLALVLSIVAAILAVVELVRSRFEALIAWGLLSVAVAVVCLTIKVVTK